MTTLEIHGTVAPGYEPLREMFAQTARPQGGSGLAVNVEGRRVVDLWQGVADEQSGRAWEADTPVVVYSCTKGLVSILIAQLVGEGRLRLDAPVSTYWPEFAAAGKGEVTVRQLLSHRAGLAATRENVTPQMVRDWDAMVELLALQEPLWQPGTAYGYHALTFGWLAGELVRRITGMSVGSVFRQRLSGALGADAWIGAPEDALSRRAHPVKGRSLLHPTAPAASLDPTDAEWMSRAMTLGEAFPAEMAERETGFDDPAVLRAEIPGAGGVASARALADIWSSTVVATAATEPLDPVVVVDMTRAQSEGAPVWWLPGPYPRWGTGFMLSSQRREFLTDRSFGHDGAGGQVAFADPERRVGFGYVTNLFEISDDERGTLLVRTLRDVLDR